MEITMYDGYYIDENKIIHVMEECSSFIAAYDGCSIYEMYADMNSMFV